MSEPVEYIYILDTSTFGDILNLSELQGPKHNFYEVEQGGISYLSDYSVWDANSAVQFRRGQSAYSI